MGKTMVRQKRGFVSRHIEVNCVPNDPVDTRCGGPHWLGFDFYVDFDEDAAEIEKFIRDTLKKYQKPLDGRLIVGQSEEVVAKLWTRDMIDECIGKDDQVPTTGSHDHERSKRGYR